MAQRQRPYSIARDASDELLDTVRRLEDQFIGHLIRARCEPRPPASALPWASDVHHRIMLEFDGDRVLQSGRSIRRKRAVDGPPDWMPRIGAAIEQAIATAVGERFPDAPADGSFTLSLPLRPIDD